MAVFVTKKKEQKKQRYKQEPQFQVWETAALLLTVFVMGTLRKLWFLYHIFAILMNTGRWKSARD
jgi:hypothetical protein